MEPCPGFLEEGEEDWPEMLAGRGDGSEVYKKLEMREREMGRRRREWEAWKKGAVVKAGEVEKLAREMEMEKARLQNRGERTPMPLRKKLRKVVGTGSQARRERTTSGANGGEAELDTPTRIEGRPIISLPLTESQRISTPVVVKFSALASDSRPSNLALPTPKSNFPSSSSTVITTSPRSAPPRSSTPKRAPSPLSVAQSSPPPRAEPITSNTTNLINTNIDSPPPPQSTNPIPTIQPTSPPRAQPPTTTTTNAILTLNRTPRKSKRRSDILHLSASGYRPPPSLRQTPGDDELEQRDQVGPSSRLMGEKQEGKGEDKRKDGDGDLKRKDEERPVGEGFRASGLSSERQLLQQQQEGLVTLAIPPSKQPESSWEPEPDTQSEHEDQMVLAPMVVRREEEEEGQRSRSKTPKILVPPSSTDESQSQSQLSQPQPRSNLSFAPLPPPPAAAAAAPLAPSKHHSNRSTPPPPPPRVNPSPPPMGNTQFLIAAAEAADDEVEDGDIEDERGWEKGWKMRRGNEREEEEGVGDMPPSAQVGSSRMRQREEVDSNDLALATKSNNTFNLNRSTSPLLLDLVKPEPLSPPPPTSLAIRAEVDYHAPFRPRQRILGGAFGSPPAPAANWKAIEKEERERKGKGRKRGRVSEEEVEEMTSRKGGREREKRRKKVTSSAEDAKPFTTDVDEEEEDIKPRVSVSDDGDDDEEGNTTRLRALDDTNFSDLEHSPDGEEDPDGHHWMRRLHAKRKLEVDKLRKEKARKR